MRLRAKSSSALTRQRMQLLQDAPCFRCWCAGCMHGQRCVMCVTSIAQTNTNNLHNRRGCRRLSSQAHRVNRAVGTAWAGVHN